MPPVDRYLAELDASLRGSRREKRDLLCEARDHLQDATQARVDAGATRRAAEAEAVRDFGAVRQIAPSYQAVLSAGQCRRLSVLLVVLVIAQPLLWAGWTASPLSLDSHGPRSAAYQVADSYVEMVGGASLLLAVVALVGGRLAFRYLGIREWMMRLVLTGALVSIALLELTSAAMLTTSGDVRLVSVGFAATVSWIPMGLFGAACLRAMRGLELTPQREF